MISPLPHIMIEDLVRRTLLEDLGRAGDLTSDAVIPEGEQATMALVAREPGIVAGLDLAALAFRLIDPAMSFDKDCADGDEIFAGRTLARIRGGARAILTAERAALNFLCHMSGIASKTARLCAAVKGHKAKIVCTRKTTPGLRVVEKYAVRAGGGSNHRFGLDDAILIKDNHIAIAGGIRTAIERAKLRAGHLLRIEVEVDTLDQLEELLALGVDAVLLDNMPVETLRQAVTMIDGRLISEASGGITPETVAAVAATGVDLISSGALTHSTRAIDIGLDCH
jgi:nicotinate-nucleotide pyrophosphorylase (carboxylating)